MQKQRMKDKLFAGLMGFMTAFSPVISVMPVYAANEDDDIDIQSVSSEDDGINVASVDTNTVSIDVGSVHGELVIDEDKDSEKTVRVSEAVSEDGEVVKKASVEDADGRVTEAVIDSENPYAIVLTEETGSVVTVKAVADSGYEVSEYRVLMDTGKAVMDEADVDFETDKYASFEYALTVDHDSVMNISFDEAEGIVLVESNDENGIVVDEGIQVESEEPAVETENGEGSADIEVETAAPETEDDSQDVEIQMEGESETETETETEAEDGNGEIEVAVESESETESETEVSEDQIIVEMDDQADEFVSVFLGEDADTSELNASDFASMRLVVLASDPSVIVDMDNVIGQYDTIYLLQYTSVQQAMNAYVYYSAHADAVEPDQAVEIATGDIEVVTDAPEEGPADEAVVSDDIEVIAVDDQPVGEAQPAEDAQEGEAEIVVDTVAPAEAEAPVVTESENAIDALNGLMEEAAPVASRTPVIALIDTGASEHTNVIDRVTVFGDDVLSGHGHADDMVTAIVSQDPDAKIISIRAMSDNGFGNISSLVAAMEYAISNQVDIINLSLYSRATLSTSVLKSEILKAVEAGIIVVGSAGNDGADVADYMPGSVEEAYIIGAATADGSRLPLSNYGSTVDYNVVAGSTSEAAALFSGFVSANGIDMVPAAVNNNGLIYDTNYIVVEDPDDDLFDDDSRTDMDVRIAYTFVDASKVDASTTIDSVMDNIISTDSPYLYTVYGQSMLYDNGDGTYSFRFDAMLKNRVASAYLADYVIAKGNNSGQVISSDQAYADVASGIGYVTDASVLPKTDGDYANMVLQVLVPIDYNSYDPYVTVNVKTADGDTAEKLIQYDPNTAINVVLAIEGVSSELTVDDFNVVINDDVHINTSELSWDNAASCLAVNYYAAPVVWKIDITLSAEATDLFRVAAEGDHSRDHVDTLKNYVTIASLPRYAMWFKEGTDTSAFDNAYRNGTIGVGDGATGYGLVPSTGFAGYGYVYNTQPGNTDGTTSTTPIAIPRTIDFSGDGTQILDVLDKDKNPISDPSMLPGYGDYVGTLDSLDIAVIFPSWCVHVSHGDYTSSGSWGNLAPGPVYFKVLDRTEESSDMILYTVAYIGGKVNNYNKWWGGEYETVGQYSGGVFQVRSKGSVNVTVDLEKTALTGSLNVAGKSYSLYNGNKDVYTDMSATFEATIDGASGTYTLKTGADGKLSHNKQYTAFVAALTERAKALKAAKTGDLIIRIKETKAPTGYAICTSDAIFWSLGLDPANYSPVVHTNVLKDNGLKDWSEPVEFKFVNDSWKSWSLDMKCADPCAGDPADFALVKVSQDGTYKNSSFADTRFTLTYYGNDSKRASSVGKIVYKGVLQDVDVSGGTANAYVFNLGKLDCVVNSASDSAFVQNVTQSGYIRLPVGYYRLSETGTPTGFGAIGNVDFEVYYKNGSVGETDDNFKANFKKLNFGNGTVDATGVIPVVVYEIPEPEYAMPIAIAKTQSHEVDPEEGTTFSGIQFKVYNYSTDEDGKPRSILVDKNNNGLITYADEGTTYDNHSKITVAYSKAVGTLDFKNAKKENGYWVVHSSFGLPAGKYCVYETRGNGDYSIMDKHAVWFTITPADVQHYYSNYAEGKAKSAIDHVNGDALLYLGNDKDNLRTNMKATAYFDAEKLDKAPDYTEGQGTWKFGMWDNQAVYFGGLDVKKTDYTSEKGGGGGSATGNLDLTGAKFAIIASTAGNAANDWIYARTNQDLSTESTVGNCYKMALHKSGSTIGFGDSPSYAALMAEYTKYLNKQSSCVVGVITTNKVGNASTHVKALANGTYYVIEVEPPKGYDVNDKYVGKAVIAVKSNDGGIVHAANIYPADGTGQNVGETPMTTSIMLVKFDQWGRSEHADYTMADTEFVLINASKQDIYRDNIRYQHADIKSTMKYNQVKAYAKSPYILDRKPVVKTPGNGNYSVTFENLIAGTYYVIEVAAGPGVKCDTTSVIRIDITPKTDGSLAVDANYTQKSAERKAAEAAGNSGGKFGVNNGGIYASGIEVQKIDFMLNAGSPHANADLSGAEFAIINASQYVAMNYEITPVESVKSKSVADDNAATYAKLRELIGGTPTAGEKCVMDIITTDKNGHAVSHAYQNSDVFGIPYGTYYIIETKAPVGYDLNTTWVGKVVVRESNSLGRPVTIHGEIPAVTGNGTTGANVPDLIHTGYGEVNKLDMMLGNIWAHGDTDLSGAQFTIVNASANPAVNYQHKKIETSKLTDTGITYAAVERFAKDSKYVMDIITTNEEGYARTHTHADAKCDKMCKDCEGLPYGVYYVIETKPASYYDLNKNWVGKIVVDKDGNSTMTVVYGKSAHFRVAAETDDELLQDQQIWTAGVEIEKIDFMRNDNVDHADANLAGAEFVIINGSKAASVNYQDTVVETVQKASIKSDDAATYAALKALIGTPTAGKNYVMDVITTNKDGYAVSHKHSDANCQSEWKNELGLPTGTYYIIETNAPEGYHVNTEWVGKVVVRKDNVVYSFNDSAANKISVIHGQIPAITSGNTGLRTPDLIYTGGVVLNKVDYMRDSTNPHGDADLSGATFKIVNASLTDAVNWEHKTIATTGLKGDDVTYADVAEFAGNDKYVMDVMTSDKTGKVVAHTHADANCDKMCKDSEGLPYGTYYVIETGSPKGYHVNTEWVGKIVVREEGTTFTVIQNKDYHRTVNHDMTGVTKEHDTWGKLGLAGGSKEIDENGIRDQIFRGGISLNKIDIEMKDATAQGMAEFEGAEFTIINASQAVIRNYEDKDVATAIDKIGANPDWNTLARIAYGNTIGNEEHKASEYVAQVIYTDAYGFASTGRLDLPYGTYYVIETKAPDGYFIDDQFIGKIVIREDNVKLQLGTTTEGGSSFVDVNDLKSAFANTVDEQVRRGDLAYQKVDIDGIVKVHVPFLLSAVRINEDGSETVIESHIVVTDEQGYIWTGRNAHSQNTNMLDDCLVGNSKFVASQATLAKYGASSEAELLAYAADNMGTWFQGNSMTYPKDSIEDHYGALYQCYYRLTELQCESNRDLEENLVNSPRLWVTNDSVNYYTPMKALNTDFASRFAALKASYMAANADTKEPTYVRWQNYVTTVSAEVGNIELWSWTTRLVDKQIVAESEALDVESNTHTLPVRASVAVTDSVFYAHLDSDHHYKLATQFVDLTTGKTLRILSVNSADETLSKDQTWVMREFQPTSKRSTISTYTGDVDNVAVHVNLDTRGLEGHTLMAVDYLYEYMDITGSDSVNGDWVLVKIHPAEGEYPDSQKLYVPDIHSYAVDSWTGDRVGAKRADDAVLENLEFMNLSAGEDYVFVSDIVDNETGESLLTKPVEYKFHYNVNEKQTPIADSLQMPAMEFDSSKFTDKMTATVITSLYRESGGKAIGEPICTHSSMQDEDETIRWIDVYTTASDSQTKDDVGTDADVATVYDVVKLENVIFDFDDHEGGYSYDLKGTLVFQKDFTDKNGVAHKAGDKVDTLDGTMDAVHVSMDADGNVKFAYADGSTAEGKVLNIKYCSNVAKYVDPSKVGDNTYIQDTNAMVCDLTVQMIFKVNSNTLAGGTVVVFEDLYHDAAGTNTVLVADHKDITDEGQTVHYPDVHTSAIDSQTKDDVGACVEHEKLIDTVKLDNLVPGRNYVVNGTLRDQATGDPIRVNGKLITQSANVHVGEDGTITTGNGEKVVVLDYNETLHEVDATVDLTFEFDARGLQGRTVVVFEDLVHNNIVVASHADIKDKDQTVHFPEIHTSAADGYTKDNVGTVVDEKGLKITDDGQTAETCVIVDHVEYKNLVKGRAYTVTGTLMDQKSGYAYVDGDGHEVIVSRTFIAGETEEGLTAVYDEATNSVSGIVDLTYTFNGSNIEGTTVVVFEDIYHNNVYLTSHADIKDKAQTVHFPKIRTSAINVATGDEVGSASEMKIKDIVSFWNLAFDRDYTVKGVLVDKQTGEFLTDKDGNIITAENPFHVNEDGTVDNCCEIPCTCKGGTCTCEDWAICVEDIDRENGDSDGHVHMVFNVDASDLAGHDIVVYEYLYHNGVIVARHTDINDLNQTIHIPDIGTSAFDIKTGDHAGTVEETAIINDHVSYKNLVVGREYTIRGILMNQATNAPVLNEDGTLVRAEATFTASAEGDGVVNVVEDYNEADHSVSGYYVITFELNSTQLKGKTVVAFEDLYHNGVKLVSHAEILDKEQSVHYPDIHTNAVDSSTGDHVGSIWGTLVNGVKHMLGNDDADNNGIADNVQQNIIDTVSLNNLVPGYTYVVSGKLYDVDASMNADMPAPLLVDGEEIVSAVTITVAANGRSITASNGAKTTVSDFDMQKHTVSGTVDLTYTLDSSKVQDTKIVVFEDLYHDKTYTPETDAYGVKPEDIIDTHSDIHDEGQSVSDIGIHTTAVDTQTKAHVGTVPSEDIPYVVIRDEVNLTKLVPSMEYTIKGVLVDMEASDFANGKAVYVKADGSTTEVRSEAYEEQFGFTAAETEEIHYLNFALSSDYVQGRAITVFEEVYHNGIMIGAHPADITEGHWDENSFKNQTVYYPTGKTNATDNLLGTHTSYASADRVVTDRVYFENLLVDETYMITGRMMYESDFTDADGVLHAKGSAVDMDPSSVRFKVSADMTEADYIDAEGDVTGAKAAMDSVTAKTLANGQVVVSGYVSIEFTVDAAKLAGATIVAFEDFENRGVTVFTHADLNDLPETIRIPKIHTNAVSGDLDEASVYDANGNFRDVKIVDTVTYTNVWTPAELLEMKEQGKAIRYRDGAYRTEDADIFTIDEVLTYIMKGVLMDKETGEVLKNSKGEAYVVYSQPFSPVKNSGTIDVTFTVNAGDFVAEGGDVSELEGKTVVAFEYMYQAASADAAGEANMVASHEEINDAEQDIRFPKARTHASDGIDASYDADGGMLPLESSLLSQHDAHKTTTSHEVFATDTIEIVDFVSVENLHGATTYVANGTLMVVTGVDAEGNTIYEPAVDDEGNLITASTEFDTSVISTDYNASVSGYVPVVFRFSGVNLAGKTTVAFETVTRDGILVAVHANIDDAPQTIYLPKIHTNAFDGLSGQQITLADGTTVILDKVTYENLEYGKTYKMTGTMMDQATGKAVRDASTEGIFVAGVENQIIMEGGTRIATLEEFRKAYGDLHIYAGNPSETFEPEKAAIYSGSAGNVDPATPAEPDPQTDPGNDSPLDISSKTEFIVGQDLKAGFYKVTPTVTIYNEEGYGYWALYKDASARTLNTVITNSNMWDDDVDYLQLVDGMLFQISRNTVDGKAQIALTEVDESVAMANLNKQEYHYLYENQDNVETTEPETNTETPAENTETTEPASETPAETTPVVDVNAEDIGKAVEEVVGGDMTKRVSGEVYVAIVVNTAAMKNTTLVAFEKLEAMSDSGKDKVIAVHEDLNDEAQSIYIPEIRTLAEFADGSKAKGAAVEMSMIDTVEYKNLIPGMEYTMRAALYDKATGKYLGYSNEVKFTPDATSGKVKVPVDFDGHELAGRSVVAFETLTTVGNGEAYIVAEHKDITDADQTIDILVPVIGTTALYKNETKTAGADAHMTVVDTVKFENLTPGVEYTLYGQLYDQATGEPVSEVASKSFTPDVVSGYTTIDIPFDGSRLGDKHVVAFETLTAVDQDGQNYIVAEHKDINDMAQMVDVLKPYIGTTARFAGDAKAAGASAEMKVYDTVAFVNLTPGTKYTVEAQMFDGDASGDTPVAVSEIAVMEYTPTETEGSFVVEIPFDGSHLAGHHVVAFETIKAEDSKGEVYVVAEHKDLNDCNQTVVITQPEIGTVARFDGDAKASGASAQMVVHDTVKYTGLTPGVEYTLYGELYDKADSKSVSEVATAKFTPETADGETVIDIPFDGSLLGGHHIVAFETLKALDSKGEEYVVAEHKDINDCNQTVTVSNPQIATVASFANESKTAGASPKMVVYDTVKYTGLTPGVEYKLYGELHDKADGKAVSEAAVATFKPEASNGETVVEIPFDGSKLGGHDIVAFETLKAVGADGKEYIVAEHKDIKDANQTVSVVNPEIGTIAVFDNGEHTAEAASKMTVNDTVSYKGLTPGVEYVLKGELMYKDSKKTTEIVGTAKFTPKEADGTAVVTFTFDGSLLVGKQLVAFEELTTKGEDGKEYIVAEHKDINDANQTVTITKPAEDRQTPDIDTSDVSMTAYLVGSMMMMVLLAGLVILRKKETR